MRLADLRHVERLKKNFAAKVDYSGVIIVPELGPCWPWKGARARLGYGNLSYTIALNDHRHMHSSRMAYLIEYGEIADDLDVCHKCDYPPCVRPTHLFAGTASENLKDMMAKGRRMYPSKRGEHNNNAKLKLSQVACIRSAYKAGENRASLARRYGVGWTAIDRIVKNRSWEAEHDSSSKRKGVAICPPHFSTGSRRCISPYDPRTYRIISKETMIIYSPNIISKKKRTISV